MAPYTPFDGLVAPLERDNVDTDAIIPKQYLKSIVRSGFGAYLFDEWRFLDAGELGKSLAERSPNPNFVLNQPRFQGAEVLVVGENFGCGSSREHAAWALRDFGIRAILSTRFAEIFYNNSLKNGLLPIELPAEAIAKIFSEIVGNEGYRVHIDLEKQSVRLPSGENLTFAIESFPKYCLLGGLDEIGLSLRYADEINQYETKRQQEKPWLFLETPALGSAQK